MRATDAAKRVVCTCAFVQNKFAETRNTITKRVRGGRRRTCEDHRSVACSMRKASREAVAPTQHPIKRHASKTRARPSALGAAHCRQASALVLASAVLEGVEGFFLRVQGGETHAVLVGIEHATAADDEVPGRVQEHINRIIS